MKIDTLTPETAALTELGDRLARIRKQLGYSQTSFAEEAGIGVATLRRIEAGHDGQMQTWIKVLKALGMASSVNALVPEQFSSPMTEVLSKRKTRKYRKRDSAGVVWGDERQ